MNSCCEQCAKGQRCVTRSGMADCDFFRRCPEEKEQENQLSASLQATYSGCQPCEQNNFWLWVALGVFAWHVLDKK